MSSEEKSHLLNIRKHLLTGVSYMIPVTVAGGLLIALSFLVGGYKGFEVTGSLADFFMRIGGGALGLIIPILAAFIAYSIADRAGMAPGFVAGAMAVSVNSGFLGGLLGGLLAGYLVYYIKKVKVPSIVRPMMAILIIPFVGSLIMGLLMLRVIGPPVAAIMSALSAWLQNLSTVNKIVFGGILGAMQAVDMGGPIDKTAYTFALAMHGQQVYAPMASVMLGGMTPPIALALATILRPKKFSRAEKSHANAAWALGLSFITEGAIPFASADPVHVIPAQVIGSATAGALSMLFGCESLAPHGGIFVLPLIKNPIMYLVAGVVGVLVTAFLVIALKPDLDESKLEGADVPALDLG